MPETEPQPQPSSLPIITSEVSDRLLNDLGLNVDSKTASIVAGITGEISSPRNNLEDITSEVFADLISSNKGLAEVINSVLDEKLPDSYSKDGTLKGMAIVIKSFHYMQNYDLLQRFGNLQPNDISLARQILENSFLQKNQDLSILQRLLKLPQIPEQQTNLNESLKKVQPYSSARKERFNTGAVTAYRLLETLWPKLYPPTQTSPPPQPAV